MRASRAISLLLLVACAVRIPRLIESLWYDEIAVWREVGVLGPGAIVTQWPDPVNHVAATLLTWCSLTALEAVLGSELAMRLPALLVSLATVPILVGLGRRAGGERVGLLAGAAASLAPVLVLEGAEARGYALMMCSAAATAWCAVVALRAPERARRAWIAFVPLAALGAWAHPVTAVVSVGQACVLLGIGVRTRHWKPVVPGLAAIASAGLLSLALYAPILDDMLAWRSRAATMTADRPSILGIEGWHALLQLGGAWWWWSALPAACVAGIGLLSLRRRVEARLPVALALAGLPVAVVLVATGGTWVYARFLLFSVPGALLLLALGADTLWSRARPLAACALGAVTLAWGADLALRPPRQPLREAAALVAAERRPDERVLVIGLRHQVFDAYGADLEPAYALFHGRDLEAQLDAESPAWIVVLYEEHVGRERMAMLDGRGYAEAARLEGWADWGAGTVVVLRRAP